MTPNVLLCRGPGSLAVEMALRRRPVGSSKGLADQLVVRRVRSDPKPHDAVRPFDANCAIVDADSSGVEATDLLEMERWMPWIALQLLEAAIGEALN
jgi:hypothetical protein